MSGTVEHRAARVLVFVALVVGAAVLSSPPTRAQSAGWTPAYPLILTPERAFAFVQAAQRRLDYVPGEVLVKFRAGATPANQQRVLSALRSRPALGDLHWVGEVALVVDRAETDAPVLAARLRNDPDVEYAEPNQLMRPSTTPNDPSFGPRQWNFSALDLPRAWDINGGATGGLIVAVIDSGVTTVTQSFVFPTWDGAAIRNISVPFAVNPDLRGARLVNSRDFVFWTGPVLDMDGHGTHVSSTIGEDTNNGLAESGIAYNATIMPLKVCVGYWEIQFSYSASGSRGFVPPDVGGCSVADEALAIRYAADNGAKVINLSLGGPGASQTLRDALTYAVSKGTFVAAAAGNEFLEGNPTEYPAGFAPDIQGVTSVGAVGRSLRRAYYSNTGSYVEIAAPGGDDLDGGAAGLIWQTTMSPADSDPRSVLFPRFDRYVEAALEGTSMASPHVAGSAALIMSQGVTNPAAVEALIKATARDLGASGRDNEYGYGLIQPRNALLGLGYGR